MCDDLDLVCVGEFDDATGLELSDGLFSDKDGAVDNELPRLDEHASLLLLEHGAGDCGNCEQ